MGNSNPKYFTEREALDVLGRDIWDRLESQLESLGGAVEFGAFYRMVLQKFRMIPKYLCECLYRGFASDVTGIIEVKDFISTLAVVRSRSTTILLSFAFRVYDARSEGEVTKQQLMKQLSIAYGDDLNQYNAAFDLDKLFENTSSENCINAREFETFKGPSRVLTEWISAVLASFLDPPPARLEALEIKYSTTREADQMMMQYNIPKSLCNKLYRMFSNLCQSPGRPEMDLKTWLKLATVYVHPALAFEIFRAKLHDVKVAWRFVDFFEFCYLFGLFLPNVSEADAETHSATTFSTVERQAAALCTIFQLAAERDTDDSNGSSSSVYATSLLKVNLDEAVVPAGSDKKASATSKKLVLYMRRLVYLLSISSVNKIPTAKEDAIGKIARRVSIDAADKSTYAYAAATATIPISSPQFHVLKLSPLDTMSPDELDALSSLSQANATSEKSVIAPVVINALLSLESSCTTDPTLKEYVGLLCGFEHFLPGFQQLSMLACCTFGVKPLVPELEKLYIIDLTLSRQDQFPQTKSFPNGPLGTEWAVLSSAWLNSWRFFVGRQRRGSLHLSDTAIKDQLAKEESRQQPTRGKKKTRRRSSGSGASPVIKNVVNAVLPMSLFSSVLKPFGDHDDQVSVDDLPVSTTDCNGDPTELPPIDNLSIVRKRAALASVRVEAVKSTDEFRDVKISSELNISTTTVPILVPGLDITQHLELVPPEVYKTLFLWYGGGPQISRSVIINELGKPELELYPLCIKVCRCDPNGNPSLDEREFMFSKMALIGDVIRSVASYYRSSDGNAKLWNYATDNWKTQKLLSDTTMTLQAAGIVDGQLLLLEVSLGDGTWPRSQRQSELEAEWNSKHSGEKGTLKPSNSLTSLVSASKVTAGGGLLAISRFPNAYNNSTQSPVPRSVLNKGRVGLDNLGNTCYMSSSLQVLLHTDQLVEYFMRKAYLKHVNIQSRHGYKGRLAHAFGKLVTNVWCTDKSSVSPRNFRQELAQIRDQFSGNEQHDAQELMVFLLDGLSEDVNLVHEKPYMENPDSDGRSDKELADIWWDNHSKRENSVIQALFTGQFKSVMHCASCQHNSARFEPFNSLALPLPEDHTQSVYVDVVTLGCKFRVQRCVVIVKRTETLQAVIDKITDAEFRILGLASASPHFLAVDTFQSRVREFHPFSRQISNIMSNETIALYEVGTPYVQTGGENGKAGDMQITPANADPVEEKSEVASPIEPADAMEAAMEDNIKPRPSQGEKVTEEVEEGEDGKKSPEIGVARIVVLQRRTRYSVGAGLSNFSLEPIGAPVVDVVNNYIPASEVYALVSAKLKHCLKAPLDVLLSGANVNGVNRHGVKGGLGTSSEASFSSPSRNSNRGGAETVSAPGTPVRKQASANDLKSYYDLSDSAARPAGSHTSSTTSSEASPPAIRPVEIEEAVAKDISTHGFVLRYIRPDGVSCAKCSWIHGCQGCLLPDSPDLMVTIDDGTVFAADWHYVVYHELIESAGPARGDIVHPSMDNARKDRIVPKISLSSCFDKFMEEEKLEGIVCPKCHEDSHLSKNFVLWRLPPVLFVQLKRFQFDRFSRKKLNDLVDFPLENLDLSPYLAPRSPNGPTTDADPSERTNCSCSSDVSSGEEHVCSTYSLYAVVHHVGIMGGGHYVASVRDNSASIEALAGSGAPVESSTTEVTDESVDGEQLPSTATTQKRDAPLSRQWWCYNDSTVTPIKEEEIVTPSAYLLFYMRNDIARGAHKLEDIFQYAEQLDEDVLMEQVQSDEKEEVEVGTEDLQPNREAKFQAGDDVSSRRGRQSAELLREEDPIAGKDKEAKDSVDRLKKSQKSGKTSGNGGNNKHSNEESTGSGSSAASKKKVGYTEEEFEKIMQHGDTPEQQCLIS